MAQISFESASQMESSRANSGPGSFDFFTLKNDGDEAIVRIMHDSVADFPIFTVHEVNVEGKFRKVNCIRDAHEPVANCPLCKASKPITNRFFIHMLQYKQQDDGSMVPTPVIWDRSMAYASKLKGMLDEYGPLSECLFKIKRHGAAGSMDTTYDILFCSPRIYNDAAYPRMTDPFKDVKLLGTVILDKDFNDLSAFLATGSFPKAQQVNNSPVASPSAPEYTPKETYTAPPVNPVRNEYAEMPTAPVRSYDAPLPTTDVRDTAPAPGAPRRYY